MINGLKIKKEHFINLQVQDLYSHHVTSNILGDAVPRACGSLVAATLLDLITEV